MFVLIYNFDFFVRAYTVNNLSNANSQITQLYSDLNTTNNKTKSIVGIYANVARKGQVYLYIGSSNENCMVINIDSSGINFRSRINGSEERMWTIPISK